MSVFLWTILSVIYLVILVTLGITTMRRDHYWLFFLGIIVADWCRDHADAAGGRSAITVSGARR